MAPRGIFYILVLNFSLYFFIEDLNIEIVLLPRMIPPITSTQLCRWSVTLDTLQRLTINAKRI